MKFLFCFFLTIIGSQVFCQTKSKPKSKAPIRDMNIVQGNQTINNFFYTINYNNYNKALSAKENAINATRGFFKKEKDTTSSYPYLRMGGLLINKNGMAKRTYGMGNDPVDPIDVDKVKGQIRINAVIRDSKGDEFARISGHEWEISNPNNIEYNNDSNGFEIRSGKRVIFQLDIEKDTVTINGMLCSEYGDCTFLSPNSFFPTEHLKEAPQRFALPPNFNIPPLFKYPRSEYLGVRDTGKSDKTLH